MLNNRPNGFTCPNIAALNEFRDGLIILTIDTDRSVLRIPDLPIQFDLYKKIQISKYLLILSPIFFKKSPNEMLYLSTEFNRNEP